MYYLMISIQCYYLVSNLQTHLDPVLAKTRLVPPAIVHFKKIKIIKKILQLWNYKLFFAPILSYYQYYELQCQITYYSGLILNIFNLISIWLGNPPKTGQGCFFQWQFKLWILSVLFALNNMAQREVFLCQHQRFRFNDKGDVVRNRSRLHPRTNPLSKIHFALVWHWESYMLCWWQVSPGVQQEQAGASFHDGKKLKVIVNWLLKESIALLNTKSWREM